MRFNLENGDLTIFMEGRFDTESVLKNEEEMSRLCKEHTHERLTLDASDLHYIASSGLRTILKFAKTEKSFRITNVSQNVYNVFEMTGFSKIIDISKALRRINLDNCEMISRGGMGAIYRISEDEIIKVNYNPADDENLHTELVKAKEAFLLGVPTAISFDIVDCGDGRKGIVYETIKSRSIGEMIQKNPEQMEELTDRYVAQLESLHSIITDNKVFNNAKDVFRSQLKDTSKYLTEEETAALNKVLEALPDGNTLVHGDAHPKNIMMQGDDMFWIDMEMMCVGHPIFDLIAIAVIVKMNNSDELTMQLSGMNNEILRRFERCFIRKYFKTEDEEMISRYSEILNLLRFTRRVFAIGMNTPLLEKYRPKTIETMRLHFFPYVDKIIEGIRYIAPRCK